MNQIKNRFIYTVNKFNKLDKRWEVQFREGSDKLWSEKFHPTKTDNGKLKAEIFIVYRKGWDNIYAVNLGIGKPGGKENKFQPDSPRRKIIFAIHIKYL